MSRRRAPIAMVGVPIVSHVLPSLALIRELVARGHRITYANAPFVADRIESAGAELVPCTSTLPVADNDRPADPIAAASLFLDDAVQALPQLRTAYDDDPADLYLYDIGAYAARALAEAQGRPLVQLSPTFVGWDGYEEDVAAHLRRLPGADAYRDRFARWLADCGATRPAAADRVLLISLGSAYTRRPAFYRQCLAAFGDLPGWHVVLQIGTYTDPEELGTIPSNVEVHSWVPQRTILEQADAFVTHAGMGGCGEGLLAGVPMIAVPQGAEQFMNADRLVELGVARRVDTTDATAETLRAALNDLVTDPECRDRSEQLQAAARAEGGTPRAADLIENMLAAARGPAF
ncbi:MULTISPECIES: nucleotide disphospho-sugar-binding domain-containing protein [unclassified Streptomyces]|uniref:nucleotide disphospho-sugar-binding domain-containing protein n=1 Tax=unclassified Streptomyces TaxID=2593676 RepID=UPI0036C5CC87